MSFLKKLLGRRDDAAVRRVQEEQYETAAERRVTSEGVEGLAADELAQQQLGQVDPGPLVDDEFKP